MKQLLASTAIALALGISAPVLAQSQGSTGDQLQVQETERPAAGTPEPGATTTGQDAITQPPSQVIETGDADDDTLKRDQSTQTQESGEQQGIDTKIIEREHALTGRPALGDDLKEIQGGGIALVPSQDITNREVKTTQSESLGQVAYVVVDSETGRISYLLTPVTAQGNVADPPERFRVLPWEAVKRDAEGGLTVDVPQEQAAQMPEISRQEFSRLQEEPFRREIERGWQRRAETQQDLQQDRAALQGEQQQGQQAQDQQTAEVDLPEGHPPVLLVGPESTEMVGRDGVPTAAVIVDEQGAELANMEHVVVDTAHGVVAYSILSAPGPQQQMAFRTSPLSSLQWDEERQAFVAPQSVAESPAHASAEEAQGSIRDESQLSELYEGSGTPPYWQPEQALDLEQDQQQQNQPETRQD